MCQTIYTSRIRGSRGTVKAPLDTFSNWMPTHHQLITVTGIITDQDIPLIARQALVGLTVCTIFGQSQFKKESDIPRNARLAYFSEVLWTLLQNQRVAATTRLLRLQRHPFDLVIFNRRAFRFVRS